MSKRKTTPVGVAVEEVAPNHSTYRLSHVLCLYAGAQNIELSMHHPVDLKGLLGPGKPVNPVEFARAIYRLKNDEMIEKLELVGEYILAENRDAVLWWRPAAMTPMWFKTATPEPRLTALNGVPLPQPPLVFLASKRQQGLSVWALALDERPVAETPLFHAPYMNTSDDGNVCLGALRGGAIAKKDGPADWERYFFDSNFSHTPPTLKYGNETDPLKRYIAFLEDIAKCKTEDETNWGAILSPSPSRTLADCLQA